jgi:hypothetical protein
MMDTLGEMVKTMRPLEKLSYKAAAKEGRMRERLA